MSNFFKSVRRTLDFDFADENEGQFSSHVKNLCAYLTLFTFSFSPFSIFSKALCYGFPLSFYCLYYLQTLYVPFLYDKKKKKNVVAPLISLFTKKDI